MVVSQALFLCIKRSKAKKRGSHVVKGGQGNEKILLFSGLSDKYQINLTTFGYSKTKTMNKFKIRIES